MKLGIFSEHNGDVEGVLQILTKYAKQSPDVIFPVTIDNQKFATSVATMCKTLGIHTIAYTDHEFTLANETIKSDDPLTAVIHQMETGDAVGIIWEDSEHDHFVLHSVEDLALDVWDISKGLAALESHGLTEISQETLKDAMMDLFDEFTDMFSTYIAAKVLESLGKAMDEHIRGLLSKDISPFASEDDGDIDFYDDLDDED